ncbi:MAG: hypothetical protein LIO86_03555 [Lachnospiraceae bacterium]|nr:hypothetical protein [Lachnospiraceae bacterium]
MGWTRVVKKIGFTVGAFAALLAVVFLTVWYFQSVEKLKVEEPLYTYVAGSRSDYANGVTLRHEDSTTWVIADGTRQTLPDVIFYCKNRDAVILQESMVWNQKSPAGQKRMDYFGEVRIENGVVVLDNGGALVQSPEGFLYNGSNTYLLLESATLVRNGEETELDPLSTVTAEYGGLLEVYEYGEKNAFSEELTDSETKIVFSNSSELLVASDKVSLTNGSWYLLLTDPSVLSSVE